MKQDRMYRTLLAVPVIATLTFLVFASCAPVASCGVAAVTRCSVREGGTSVRETCGADGRWRVTLDCGEVSQWSGTAFACGPAFGGGVTCLPKSHP